MTCCSRQEPIPISVCPQVAIPGMFEGLKPGATPLMIAAQEGNLPLVNRLLDAGADWRLRDSKGKTAVDLATGAGHTQILKRLEEAGATVNYESNRLQNAALLNAVEHQNVDGVRQALAAGRADRSEAEAHGPLAVDAGVSRRQH